MSLTFDPKTGDPVHEPKRRDVFEFDHEVATIFENMALRSIPMYAETHRVHAQITKEYADEHFPHRQYAVADIGASTGMYLKYLQSVYGTPIHAAPGHFRASAIDPSQHMLNELIKAMPWVSEINIEAQFLDNVDEKFDVVNVSYVLQFIPRKERLMALQSIAKALRPNGLLFVSQKESIHNEFDRAFTEQYIQFRKDNGYTAEEIAAKTEALKNSMWVDPVDRTKSMLREEGFWNFQDTTRWLGFCSFVCTKL